MPDLNPPPSAHNRALVVQVGGDTAIINAMFKFPDNSLLQQRGLGTLCNLCIGSGTSRFDQEVLQRLGIR